MANIDREGVPPPNEFDASRYQYPEKAEEAHRVYLEEVSRTTEGQQPSGAYTVGRRLGKKEDATKYSSRAETYHQVLPSENGVTFEDSLEQLLATKETVTLCDLGFGVGQMIIDLSRKEPFKSAITQGKLKVIAIGNENFSKHQFNDPETLLIMPPTYDALRTLNVTIDNRDILETLWTMPDDSIDLFVSAVTLNWVKYPKYDIIKQINRVLKRDGVAYLSDINLEISVGGSSPWEVNQKANQNTVMKQAQVPLTISSRGIILHKCGAETINQFHSLPYPNNNLIAPSSPNSTSV